MAFWSVQPRAGGDNYRYGAVAGALCASRAGSSAKVRPWHLVGGAVRKPPAEIAQDRARYDSAVAKAAPGGSTRGGAANACRREIGACRERQASRAGRARGAAALGLPAGLDRGDRDRP